MHSTDDFSGDTFIVHLRTWLKRISSVRYVETVPVVVASIIMLSAANYTVSHPSPPGLYYEMARTIQNAGYGLPTTIPHYTENGIPFAYPPLGFYLLAVLQDLTGAAYNTIGIVLTWIEYIVFGLLAALFSRTLFEDRTRLHTSIASVLIVVTPAVFYWQLRSPEACIRLLGMNFLLGGLYFGVRLFRDTDRSAVLGSLVLFAGTILSHPAYIPVFAVSFVLLYGSYDRSITGLGYGIVVGIGGVLLTAPWWGLVASHHGIEIFLTAAGTHGGIGARSGLEYLQPAAGRFTVLREVTLAIVGCLYCLQRKRWFLPLWLVSVTILFKPGRFVGLVEPLLVAVTVCEVILPRFQDAGGEQGSSIVPGMNTMGVCLVAMLLLGGTASGVTFVLDNQKPGPSESFYNTTDWIEDETEPSASFVTYDTRDEIAFYSERTFVNLPWGAEWETKEAFGRMKHENGQLRTCSHPECLSEHLSQVGYAPDYIVLMYEFVDVSAFDQSSRYTRVFTERKHVVYRVRSDKQDSMVQIRTKLDGITVG